MTIFSRSIINQLRYFQRHLTSFSERCQQLNMQMGSNSRHLVLNATDKYSYDEIHQDIYINSGVVSSKTFQTSHTDRCQIPTQKLTSQRRQICKFRLTFHAFGTVLFPPSHVDCFLVLRHFFTPLQFPPKRINSPPTTQQFTFKRKPSSQYLPQSLDQL